MLKRIVVLGLVFSWMFFCFCLTGCSGEFKAVSEVTFTTNGQRITKYSTRQMQLYSSQEEITFEEYHKQPDWKKISDYDTSCQKLLTNNTVYKSVKGATTYTFDATGDDLDRYSEVWIDAASKTFYFKCKVKYTIYQFIYVKVINNTTIVIRDHTGDTTYIVSSFNIKYFQ